MCEGGADIPVLPFVFTQHFVRLPLSSQERGPGGEVLLPECRQKKGLRRLYRSNTRGRAVRLLRYFPRCNGRGAKPAFRCAPCDHIGYVEPESPGDPRELVDFVGRCALNALQNPRKVLASHRFLAATCRPPGCGVGGVYRPLTCLTVPAPGGEVWGFAAPPVLPSTARLWSGGFFRADPSSSVVWLILGGSQGNVSRFLYEGDSRKNRPRAERRRSFWSFFLGVQEKGRREEKSTKYKEACVKVGQTFLSAHLVFTQHFVRLPLSSQERGPGGAVLLPECRQKKGLRRLYRANTRGRAVRFLGGFPGCSGRSAKPAFRCVPCDHRIRRAGKSR